MATLLDKFFTLALCDHDREQFAFVQLNYNRQKGSLELTKVY
jgi:hypothetical protein